MLMVKDQSWQWEFGKVPKGRGPELQVNHQGGMKGNDAFDEGENVTRRLQLLPTISCMIPHGQHHTNWMWHQAQGRTE